MKKQFKEFIKNAHLGQCFFSVETGLKYKITKIAKTYTLAIEMNKRDFGKANEEVKWDNHDNYKVIF